MESATLEVGSCNHRVSGFEHCTSDRVGAEEGHGSLKEEI